MLILAGVVLNLTIGQNGIMQKTYQGSEQYSRELAKEELEIALLDLQTDKIVKSEYNEGEYINQYLQEKQMIVEGDIVTVKGWKFKIDRKVPKIGEVVEEEFSETVFTFGDKTEEYDGISGKCEEFIVPYTGYYKLEVWGAQGGSGGNGGYSSGYIKLQKEEKLYVYVGGRGQDRKYIDSNYLVGGFNGGGNSGIPSYYTVLDGICEAFGSGYIGNLVEARCLSGTEQVPSYDGTTNMIGNRGDGYAKITCLFY